jgi:hypothetical protein
MDRDGIRLRDARMNMLVLTNTGSLSARAYTVGASTIPYA